MHPYLTRLPLALALFLPACDAGGLLVVQSSGTTGAGGATTTTTHTATSHGTGGTGGVDPNGGGDAASCSALACPSGAFSSCEPIDTMTSCCKSGATFSACSRPSGILTHDGCGGCQECTVSPLGTVTCCSFGSPTDPCAVAVP